MIKYNNFVKFLKKTNLLFNNLLRNNLNKLNFNNLLNIGRSNKISLLLIALIILFLSYLLLPNIYDKDKIYKELKNQLFNNYSLNFNLSPNLKYNFFPRPHFINHNSIILKDKNEISKVKKLKIYVSLGNLFSLKNIKVNNVVLENANFNLTRNNYNFFIKLLDQNFKENNFIITNSNIFYRNIDNEVLFINKIINMKYYFDANNLKNISVSKNKIFNLPYSFEIYNNKNEKKLFSKLNLNFLKIQIENEINYSNDIIEGSSDLIYNQNQSNITYELKKNFLKFNLIDKSSSKDFSYEGNFNFKPFYSYLKGDSKKIDLSHFYNSNSIIIQLLKSEILNNKNLDFDLSLNSNKVKNYHSFIDIFLKSKIQEGLIDIDNTKISWKNFANFLIKDSLIYVKNGQLILDGNLNIDIKNHKEIYKFLLTPKNQRAKIDFMKLNFIYNFDQKILNFNEIEIDGKKKPKVNSVLKNILLKDDNLQNKIYLKKIINRAIKSYSG